MDGRLPKARPDTLLELAYEQGIITEAETTLVCEAEFVRNDAIQVDAFTFEAYQRSSGVPRPDDVSKTGSKDRERESRQAFDLQV